MPAALRLANPTAGPGGTLGHASTPSSRPLTSETLAQALHQVLTELLRMANEAKWDTPMSHAI